MLTLIAASVLPLMSYEGDNWLLTEDTDRAKVYVSYEVPFEFSWSPAYAVYVANKKDEQKVMTVYAVDCRNKSQASVYMWFKTSKSWQDTGASEDPYQRMNFIEAKGKTLSYVEHVCKAYVEASK